MLPFFPQSNYNVRVHVIYSNWIKIIAFYRIVRRLQGYLKKKQTEFKRSLQKNNWQKRISNSQKRVDLDYKSRNKLSNKIKLERRTEVMNWLQYESSKRVLLVSSLSYCRSSWTLYEEKRNISSNSSFLLILIFSNNNYIFIYFRWSNSEEICFCLNNIVGRMYDWFLLFER